MKLPDPMRRIIIPFIIAVYSAILGYIAGMLIFTPYYTSHSKCYVTDTLASEAVSDSALKILDKNFNYFITSDGFYQTISLNTEYIFSTEELKKMIRISHIDGTNMYDVSVKAKNSSDSYQLQIIIADSMDNFVYTKSGHSMRVNFLDSSEVPNSPSDIPYILLSAAAGIIGFTAGMLITKKNKKKAEEGTITASNYSEYCSLPVMARILETPNKIPSPKKSGAKDSIIRPERIVTSPFFSQFSDLFEKIKFSSENPCCIITVCSSVRNEGKSHLATGLAAAAALKKVKVLLIDADFHHSSIPDYFDFPHDHPGLSDIIFKNIKPSNAIMLTGFKTLYVMGPGTLKDNSRAAFSPAAMRSALDQLKYMFNYIIIDTPELNSYPDASAPIMLSDVSLLAVRSGYTYAEDLDEFQEHMRLSGLEITGVVLNRISQDPVDAKASRKNSSKPKNTPKPPRKRKINITV